MNPIAKEKNMNLEEFFCRHQNNKMQKWNEVEFIRNGDDVRDVVQEEEQMLLAEQMRMDEIRKEEREKKNLQCLKGILWKWDKISISPF